MAAVLHPLVIGYGNPLRGDDAVGPYVAEAVDSWRRPDVQARAVHQLTPELVELLAGAGQVVFVDACIDAETDAVSVQRLESAYSGGSLGHVCDPRWLLALCRALHGRCPDAWLVTVPGVSLEFGVELSEAGRRGIGRALEQIKALLDAAMEAAARPSVGRAGERVRRPDRG
jgi:hydrogenase maturation protease